MISLQIDLLARLADVERAHGPALVKEDVLDAVLCGEVDEILVVAVFTPDWKSTP